MNETVPRKLERPWRTARREHFIYPIISLLICMTAQASESASSAPYLVGLIRDTRLAEISGMASSRLEEGRYWVHNDSGNRGDLFAIDTQGALQARLHIAGVKMLVDPEDIASFELQGRSYLLLADTGDNGGVRKSVEILVLEEPALDSASADTPLDVAPAWRIHFHYADAPHDVEAVAVDRQAKEILLLTKRTDPPELWALPLRPADDTERVAELRGSLQVPPSAHASPGLTKLSPTALDIAPDGSCAYVLTYREVWRYARQPGEAWSDAFQRMPDVLPFALVPQAEALSLTRDGRSLRITGEHWPAPIVQIDLDSNPATNAAIDK